MNNERYMSWFRQVVEEGWVCGLYRPQEILANYLLHDLPVRPYTDPVPYEHINRFMIDTMMHECMLTKRPTLQEAVNHFNRFYEDGRFDFGHFARELKHGKEETVHIGETSDEESVRPLEGTDGEERP